MFTQATEYGYMVFVQGVDGMYDVYVGSAESYPEVFRVLRQGVFPGQSVLVEVEPLVQWQQKEELAMKNIETKVTGDKLIITIDLTKNFGLSGSGKSLIIASTEGNISVPGREDVKIGLNVYRPQSRNGER